MTLRDPELLDLLADEPDAAGTCRCCRCHPAAPADRCTGGPRRRGAGGGRRRRGSRRRRAGSAARKARDRRPRHRRDRRRQGAAHRDRAADGNVDVDLRTAAAPFEQAPGRVLGRPAARSPHAVMTFKGKVVLDLLWPQDAQKGATSGPSTPPLPPSGAAIGKRSKTARRRAPAKATPSAIMSTGCVSAPRRTSRPAARSPSTRRRTSRSSGASTTAPSTSTSTSSSPRATDLASADFTRHGPIRCGCRLRDHSSSGGSSMHPRTVRAEHDRAERLADAPGPEGTAQQLAAVIPRDDHYHDKKTFHGIQLVYGTPRPRARRPRRNHHRRATRTRRAAVVGAHPSRRREIEKAKQAANGTTSSGPATSSKNGRYLTITTLHGEQAVIDVARSLQLVK